MTDLDYAAALLELTLRIGKLSFIEGSWVATVVVLGVSRFRHARGKDGTIWGRLFGGRGRFSAALMTVNNIVVGIAEKQDEDGKRLDRIEKKMGQLERKVSADTDVVSQISRAVTLLEANASDTQAVFNNITKVKEEQSRLRESYAKTEGKLDVLLTQDKKKR